MRANSPTDGDFSVLNVVEDFEAPAQKLTAEDKELAKIGASKDWQVILNYLEGRIANLIEESFKQPIEAADLEKVGAGFMTTRAVVNELRAVINKVELTTKAVQDAVRAS